ncbi:MAG: DUF1553 domain-containing protein [Terriglobia bacterium]
MVKRAGIIFFSILFLACLAFSIDRPEQSPVKAAAGMVDFQRVVRPILSDNCFHCHGPDANTRMADLRLDTKEGAFAVRESGTVIVAGKPQESLLYQRITAEDVGRRMPPESSHKSLTGPQIEILKKWIEQGAGWKEHWSFAAPVRPKLPEVKAKGWVRNPIDEFILAKLEAAGLEPAPEADRRTLVRRLSLDLTGLPPEPAEVEAFVKDKSKDAYEKQVDRLLGSAHWGEHRGRYWLDAARYADTHGIHVDNYREMWPYRDWVIGAFNRNERFDRFTIEQLAGDLLPNRTMEQQIASGFQRCNVTTNEGGVIAEEVEAIYAKDRVDTTGTVWLGLTVGCATCHDHKFDPISQKDFYSMTAFFRNTTQYAMDGNAPDTPPAIVVPGDKDLQVWSQLNQQERSIRDQMQQKRSVGDPAFDQWLKSKAPQQLKSPFEESAELLSLSLGDRIEAKLQGETSLVSVPEGITVGEASIPGSKSLKFGANAQVELPHIDYFAVDRPFSVAVWIFQPTGSDNFAVVNQIDPSDKNRGWVLEIGARVVSFRMIGDDGKTVSISAGFQYQLKPGTWNHIAVSYDGSRKQAGMGFYLNGKAIPTQGAGDQVTDLAGDIRNSSPILLGGNGKLFFQGGAVSDLHLFSRSLSAEEAQLASYWQTLQLAIAKPMDQWSAEDRDAFHVYYLTHVDNQYRELASRLKDVKQQKREIKERSSLTLVMEENPDTKPMAYVLFRGQYDQKRDKVEPNVPAALPPLPASYPRNRLGLAEWLVDGSNPLTGRVTVNRFWQEVFGVGLVKTSEDFGSQGQAPSHPELLDWLAVEFRESGWDVKRFFKLMVMSATYRQSAVTTEEKLKKDPENRLLSRGPRFRMDGEMVRDYALAASGLLVERIGGPSVKPYQPDGVWETVAMLVSNTRYYKQGAGDDLYRRSLYTFWKRSAPPASMEIFNAPTRETCTVRRERTDTPLQALVTMNDPQFVEAARSLAQRALLADRANLDRQFRIITGRLLARPFTPKELEIVKHSYADFLNYYDAHPEDAQKLLAVGMSKSDLPVAAPQVAALTMVANQVMNLDEVFNK